MRPAGGRRLAACMVAVAALAAGAPCALAAGAGPAVPPASSPAAAQAEAPVYTRAVVRSIFTEDGGKRLYIALKIVPGGKIPFSTITHRVLEPRLLDGVRPGDSVGFTARRAEGENVVTALKVLPPCQRFQPCD